MRRTKIVATIGPATSEPDAMQGAARTRASTSCGSTPRTARPTCTPSAPRSRAPRPRRSAASSACSSTCPGPKLRTGPVVDDEVELRVGQPVHAHRRRRSTATSTASRRRCPSSRSGCASATRCSSPTARSCCASSAIDGDDVECRGRARRRAALAQGHARAARRRPRRAVHRRRRGRARDGRRRSRPTSSACRSCAGPKTSRRCAPACPKRGHRPHLVAKIETAVALDHLAGIVARRRRGDGRARRSRHPGARRAACR